MEHTTNNQEALDYHRFPKPGKIAIAITKSTASKEDLSLAYTPGVAVPVEAIAKNPEDVYNYTSKGNLVAVVTNGSSVLGLGDVGPLASKPVMEGKAVLLKRFADIDVFDIEIDTKDPDLLISAVKCIAPTFGGILLEDIKPNVIVFLLCISICLRALASFNCSLSCPSRSRAPATLNDRADEGYLNSSFLRFVRRESFECLT